jgi:hypothetical protein
MADEIISNFVGFSLARGGFHRNRALRGTVYDGGVYGAYADVPATIWMRADFR